MRWQHTSSSSVEGGLQLLLSLPVLAPALCRQRGGQAPLQVHLLLQVHLQVQVHLFSQRQLPLLLSIAGMAPCLTALAVLCTGWGPPWQVHLYCLLLTQQLPVQQQYLLPVGQPSLEVSLLLVSKHSLKGPTLLGSRVYRLEAVRQVHSSYHLSHQPEAQALQAAQVQQPKPSLTPWVLLPQVGSPKHFLQLWQVQ